MLLRFRKLMAVMSVVVIAGAFFSVQNDHSALAQVKVQTIELEASAISSSAVRLTWRINNPGVIGGIRVYRAHSVAPDNFHLLTVIAPNLLSYVDSGLKPESTWVYRIQTQGRKPVQLSAASNSAKVTTKAAGSDPAPSDEPNTTTNSSLNAIQTLTAKALNANQIELRWAVPNLPHVAALRVYRASSLDMNNFVQVGSVGANLNTYVDSLLKPRTTYYYQLKYAVHSHAAILSPPSNTASVATPDGPEPNPRAAATSLRPRPGIPFELPSFGIGGSAVPYDDREEEMLYLLNQYRALRGLGPVRPSITLSQAADYLSRQLAESGGGSKYDAPDGELTIRARMFNFPNYQARKFDTSVFLTRGRDDFDLFDRFKHSQEDAVLINPNWKVVGIGRASSERDGSTRWVFDFADYWDKTIPLPGEDTDGRIDGNEQVRTRPSFDGLLVGAKFSGYGDDGKPYSEKHCDLETDECWKDPAPATNRSLMEQSLPENLIGTWHAQYQVSSRGVWHFNDPDRFDATDFTMTLRINDDGTWVSQGYKTDQKPTPQEAGTWKWTHDVGRNEEVVTFYRDEGRPMATIRAHASANVLTFFAVDGGEEMKGFLKGIAKDVNPKDDPQVIFVPGPAKFFVEAGPFPASLRCAACPQVFVRW